MFPTHALNPLSHAQESITKYGVELWRNLWREALNNVMEQNNDNKAVDTYMKYFLQISLSTVQTPV